MGSVLGAVLRGVMVGVVGTSAYFAAEILVNVLTGFHLPVAVWAGVWIVYAVVGLGAGLGLGMLAAGWRPLRGLAPLMAAFLAGLLFVPLALPINSRVLPDLISPASLLVNGLLVALCASFGLVAHRRLSGASGIRLALGFLNFAFCVSLFLAAASYVDTFVADTPAAPRALALYGAFLLVCTVLYLVANRLVQWVTRAPVSALAAAAAVALVTAVVGAVAGRTSGAAVRTPGATQKPNVLWIIMDTVRRDHLSLYGHAKPTTPHVDAIAADGVVFEQAMSPASWTVPSHFEMVTSRVASGKRTQLDAGFVTAAELYKEQGYDTAAVVANLSLGRRSGFEQGFDALLDGPPNIFYLRLFEKLNLTQPLLNWRLLPTDTVLRWLHRKTFFEGQAVRADGISDRAIRWIDGRNGTPFFLFINYMDAHDAYDPPQPYRDRFAAGIDPEEGFVRYNRRLGGPISSNQFVRDVAPHVTPEGWQRLEQLYDGEIAFLDEQIGRLIDRLKTQGLYDRTMIVVTADHGELFGEHGLANHFKALSEEELRVPLIVRHPGTFPAGRRVHEPVELIDLLPTLLEASSIPAREPMDGRSLLPRLAATDGAAPAFSMLLRRPDPNYPHTAPGHLIGIRGEDFKYVWSSTGQHAYYDLASDPGATKNLYGTRTEVTQLEQQTMQWRQKVGLEELEGGGATGLQRERLRALGYVE